MQKELFVKPEIEVVKFSSEDIVTVSMPFVPFSLDKGDDLVEIE